MAFLKLPAAMLCILVLGGCAYPYGTRDYRGYETRGAQEVRFGIVETVREVKIQPGESGAGAFGGAALGSIAGSYAGGSSSANAAGAIAGMLLGGLIGSSIERSANERPGVEVVVLLDSGKYVAVVQEADEQFRSGDRVRILSGRGATRVTH